MGCSTRWTRKFGGLPTSSAEARRLLRENRAKLDAIATPLLAHESLDEPEIYAAAGIARPAVTRPPAPVPA